ncbi:MAG: hypothetical protein R2731_05770 [Nocardioides sp.]
MKAWPWRRGQSGLSEPSRSGWGPVWASVAPGRARRGGELLDDLAQDGAGRARDGEVAGEGAVGVVVEDQSGLGPGGGFLLPQGLVVVAVGLVLGGDVVEGAAGLLAQRDEVEGFGVGDQSRASTWARWAASGCRGGGGWWSR